MADDKTKKLADAKRISLKEDYEMAYWKKRFKVSGQALAGAVRAVGPMVAKVEDYLKAKQKK
jgi:hypothetical protein